jgi:hypothetical protein
MSNQLDTVKHFRKNYRNVRGEYDFNIEKHKFDIFSDWNLLY